MPTTRPSTAAPRAAAARAEASPSTWVLSSVPPTNPPSGTDQVASCAPVNVVSAPAPSQDTVPKGRKKQRLMRAKMAGECQRRLWVVRCIGPRLGQCDPARNRASLGLAPGFSRNQRAANLGAGTVALGLGMCDDSYMAWTVLVVDDHPAFRASARRLLELDGLEVVGEAADAESAVRAAREIRPDVILLDIGLPDRSGYEVAEQLAAEPVAVVLVSSRAQSDLGRRASESGALGFVSKERLSGEAILALLEQAA
jgi:CheY-like chemotaxis protein